ncbi:carboxylate transporter [Corynebacterium yudongzhengii]|uniref:Sodium-dependent dicarboxylate transporter SdcS n=1 Tax=Corynebacterium yudongzhengii TaxID=2080740 RepID=A0A2U1T5N6_9CORY|nr:DASS family sodium-coupled anion symporter [Corynebacterium yudongzhengii]AWB81040.1 carboxylate transporter [Corynebacterium yudongzhengii]PWC01285.1 carboxylate transporter [Corynebacterium yudongzhengii]
MSSPVNTEIDYKESDSGEELDRGTWRRQAAGIIIGLVLAAIVFLIFPADAVDTVEQSIGADPEADYNHQALRVVAAVTVLMATWWMTEAIPLAATALIPIAVFPIAQVSEFSDVGSPYASSTIFLFLGGFLLALGLQRWNIHRRLALAVVALVGTKPKQLILGFMLATGFLSMWVSNTATAVVMLPIGISVLTLTADSVGGWRNQKKFATALMLAIAYSASIGSLGTLIGTPPNALMAGYLEGAHGITIGFGEWMMVGVPVAVVFMIIAWLVLITIFAPEMKEIPGGKELIRNERKKLGPWEFPQVAVSVIFVAAALAWVFVPLALDHFEIEIIYEDAIIGVIAGVLMFILPASFKTGERVLDWKTANELPWDVLLLFGGGLSLSAAFSDSGLSLWIGEMARGLGALPTILLVMAIAALILVLTEFTSNTATAATFLPIMGGVAVGIGLTDGGEQNVLLLVIPVALAATCAFMMPVATPPNAIAYGSGYVRIGDMIKGGVFLNIIAVFLITAAVYFIAIPVFGISL